MYDLNFARNPKRVEGVCAPLLRPHSSRPPTFRLPYYTRHAITASPHTHTRAFSCSTRLPDGIWCFMYPAGALKVALTCLQRVVKCVRAVCVHLTAPVYGSGGGVRVLMRHSIHAGLKGAGESPGERMGREAKDEVMVYSLWIAVCFWSNFHFDRAIKVMRSVVYAHIEIGGWPTTSTVIKAFRGDGGRVCVVCIYLISWRLITRQAVGLFVRGMKSVRGVSQLNVLIWFVTFNLHEMSVYMRNTCPRRVVLSGERVRLTMCCTELPCGRWGGWRGWWVIIIITQLLHAFDGTSVCFCRRRFMCASGFHKSAAWMAFVYVGWVNVSTPTRQMLLKYAHRKDYKKCIHYFVLWTYPQQKL